MRVTANFGLAHPTLLRKYRLQPGRRRQRQALAETLFFEQFREQERELDRLLGVQSRIAEGMVAVVEVLVADGAGASGTFRYVLSGHLQMDAARIGAFGLVDGKETLDLGEDAVERPGLVPGHGRDG